MIRISRARLEQLEYIESNYETIINDSVQHIINNEYNDIEHKKEIEGKKRLFLKAIRKSNLEHVIMYMEYIDRHTICKGKSIIHYAKQFHNEQILTVLQDRGFQ